MLVAATGILLALCLPAVPTHAESGDESSGKQTETSGWPESFPPSELPGALTGRKLVVVEAGDRLDRARAAADALRSSLDEAGAPLVMDGSSLGDVSDQPDREIVEAASELPVEGVVVVRIFAGGGAPNAVVSGYGPDGVAVAGFSVRKGEPVEIDDDVSAGRGISQKTLDAIDSAGGGGGVGSGSSRPRFVLSALPNWKVTDRKKGRSYKGAEIYRWLDRPELADQYESNLRTRKTFRWIGVGTGVAGLAVGGIGLVNSDGNDTTISGQSTTGDPPAIYPECEESDFDSVEQNCIAEKQGADEADSSPSSSSGDSSRDSGIPVVVITGGAIFVVGATITTLTMVGNPHPLSWHDLGKAAQQKAQEKASGGDTEIREEEASNDLDVGWSVAPTKGGWQGAVQIRW